MSNIFTCNPIRFNIFDFQKKKITKTYVILSDLEEKINVELLNILKEGKPKKEKILKKFLKKLKK